MRVILDTDVMVAAFRSAHGASRRCLLWGLKRRVTPLVSTPLLLEYEAVLTRPEHLSISCASAEDVSLVLDAVGESSDRVRLDYLWRPQLGDAGDEMVLETAVNGQADVLVTFNLVDLSKAAVRFGIRALRPGGLVRMVEA